MPHFATIEEMEALFTATRHDKLAYLNGMARLYERDMFRFAVAYAKEKTVELRAKIDNSRHYMQEYEKMAAKLLNSQIVREHVKVGYKIGFAYFPVSF